MIKPLPLDFVAKYGSSPEYPKVELRASKDDLYLIDATKLAKKCDISIRTVRRILAKGCPYYRVGKHKRFDFSEVLEWFRNQTE